MICRVCVIESINVKNIFKARSTKYKMADTIYQHFGFLPLSDDPISNVICTSCWTQIENFHGYYLNVQDAQKRFNEMLLEKAVKKNECSPIDEIKEECEVKPIEAIVMEEKASDNWCADLVTKKENIPDLGDELKVENEGDVSGAEEEDREIAAGDLDWLYSSCSTDNSDSSNASKTKEEIPKETAKANKPLKDKKSTACKKPRKRKSSTERPRSNRKDLDDEIAKQTTLKCDLCTSEFETFAILQKHYDGTHQEKGYVVCCLKKFYRRSTYFYHLMRHVQTERPKCELCGKMYVDIKSLKKHMEIYHGSSEEKTFQCDRCANRYNKRFLLKQHMRSHEPKQTDKFPCEKCGKSYKTINSLQSHRRAIHENAYTFMCDICAKVFRSKIAFERHKRKHAGISEPPLQCSQCQKWYKNLDRLKRHVRDHKIYDGKVHVCNICEKVSPSYIALRKHQKYLHFAQRTHQCTLCDSAFKEKVTLKEHMATHTGAALYSCPHCSKTSNSRANMYAHNKRMHPVEWELAKKTRELAASSND